MSSPTENNQQQSNPHQQQSNIANHFPQRKHLTVTVEKPTVFNSKQTPQQNAQALEDVLRAKQVMSSLHKHVLNTLQGPTTKEHAITLDTILSSAHSRTKSLIQQ